MNYVAHLFNVNNSHQTGEIFNYTSLHCKILDDATHVLLIKFSTPFSFLAMVKKFVFNN